MAIINMDTLFDKLQEYINRKIGILPETIEELFIEYGLKDVYQALPEIKTISNNIVEVNLVAHNMSDVLLCADNMNYIQAAPNAALTAVEKAAEAAQSATDAETSKNFSYQWSSENEDTLIDDGVHQGYSAYHWAKKAEEVNPDNFYWRDGSRPLTNHLQGNNYQLKFIGDGTDSTDAVNVRQFEVHTNDNANPHNVTKEQVNLGNVENIAPADMPISNATQTELNLKANLSGAIFTGSVKGIAPTDVDELTRKDYVDSLHGLTYEQTDFIDVSTGTPDAGKPIVLNSNGVVDGSMINVSALVPKGDFTPIAGTEYPDSPVVGEFWYIAGVDDVNGYTYTSGDLNGITVYNGGIIMFAESGWIYKPQQSFDDTKFYKLDGTQSLTANFAGGGFKITNIAPATTNGEAVEYSQIATFAADFVMRDGSLDMTGNLDLGGYGILNLLAGSTAGDAIEHNQWITKNNEQDTNITNIQNDIDNHVADITNPHSVTAAQVGALTPDGDGSGLTGITAGQVGAEPTVAVGTAGQLWATNATADGKEWIDPPSAVINWGEIQGTLSNQTDLQAALDTKVMTAQENGVGTLLGNAIVVTQAEYDALTPVSTTMYVIVG